MTISPKQFLNILIKNKVIKREDAGRYEVESLQKNIAIDLYLLNYTKIEKEEILKAKAEILNLPWVNVEKIPIAPQALSLISEVLARKYKLIPFEINEKDNSLKVAMADPLNLQVIEFLEKKTDKKIIPVLSLKDDIEKTINIFYTQGLSPDIVRALKEIEPQVRTVRVEDIGNIIKEAPIAKIVTTILEYAIKGRASDIHIEPQESRSRVRYRIDGVLHEKLSLPKGIHDSLVSRIKILSELKIDEKRLPQDGRFNFKVGEEEVDLRVSTLPTIYGEKVVMRLLKKTGGIPTLPELGLHGPQLKLLEESISKPYGIILVTGPTGSGKSTTLYSILSKLNQPGVNIVTIEDPVEYEIAGINQVHINPQAGLTFATGLRAFLRQDPNIILVGEIRDRETTRLAIQAALTGHLVFSTLHTNDAATAIPRLIDLGAEPFLISSVLNASVAQRICRRICPNCKTQYNASTELLENIKYVLGDLFPNKFQNNQPITLFKGTGCSECNNTGYFERIAIFEIIKISLAINKMIITHPTAKEIGEQANKEGLITMKQDGYLKALEGITTIDEVLRVAEV
jgi:type IV pilus assembly protein PilB